ncbi:NAD-binding protein [Oscillatoria sp. FACHB-1407]|uniref:potassium channel family protein n=1 Tax=Oscillatoria sp. FACHB-1407 TaxID=2692847 RepID=UPI00168A2B24|nr:NAD-binding protein [Oscillatoria sp. FACHB-1407]MBD2460052.1 NAD-binding protein [Oscillatoria sp. FACHB-1407]
MNNKPLIIVCGLGRTGHKIFSLLKQQGAQVVGVHSHPLNTIEDHIITGDLRAATTLIQAGIADAHTLVLSNSDDALNLAILTQARVLNPHIRIINRLFNTSLGNRLDRTLPNHFTMSVAALSAPVFTFAAMGNRAIGQLRLFQQTWPIHEEYIDAQHPWWGHTLTDLWENRDRMLIYYLPADSSLDLVSAVTQKQPLRQGDRLIIATKPQVQQNRRSLTQRILGLFTRLRQFQQHIRPTLITLLVLAVTIGAATLTYTAANFQVSLVDALYFAVGMITGAGGNESIAEKAPVEIKVFTVVMMLIGTAVVGICYALLNDLILGTRLQQLWKTFPIPQRHHYIICGLGGVGMQIVHQLHANGCSVVVIEQDSDNRFLSSVHALRIPVVQGDASLPETLIKAHIERATALLAVTSNDVTNLEIALTAKGLAPKIPVIVRNQDPQFAPLAQQVFDFEAVLSPAELAAPSFAAAALGGQVFGNGMTANTLWVALATMITSGHPFYGKQVREIAIATDLVPLYLETRQHLATHAPGESDHLASKQRTVHGWDLLEITLGLGDVLYLTIPAAHLEQLWRVSPHSLSSSVLDARVEDRSPFQNVKHR